MSTNGYQPEFVQFEEDKVLDGASEAFEYVGVEDMGGVNPAAASFADRPLYTEVTEQGREDADFDATYEGELTLENEDVSEVEQDDLLASVMTTQEMGVMQDCMRWTPEERANSQFYQDFKRDIQDRIDHAMNQRPVGTQDVDADMQAFPEFDEVAFKSYEDRKDVERRGLGSQTTDAEELETRHTYEPMSDKDDTNTPLNDVELEEREAFNAAKREAAAERFDVDVAQGLCDPQDEFEQEFTELIGSDAAPAYRSDYGREEGPDSAFETNEEAVDYHRLHRRAQMGLLAEGQPDTERYNKLLSKVVEAGQEDARNSCSFEEELATWDRSDADFSR